MTSLAAICALGGLILGANTNIRVFVVIAVLMASAALVAGIVQHGLGFSAVAWLVTTLVSMQVGYMAMIITRMVWRDVYVRRRHPAPF